MLSIGRLQHKSRSEEGRSANNGTNVAAAKSLTEGCHISRHPEQQFRQPEQTHIRFRSIFLLALFISSQLPIKYRFTANFNKSNGLLHSVLFSIVFR